MPSPSGISHHGGPTGALFALLVFLQAKVLLVYASVEAHLVRLQAQVGRHLHSLAQAVGRAVRVIVDFPRVVYARAVIVAMKLAAVLHFVFVTVPKWLVLVLPGRVLAAIVAFGGAVRRFFTNEVVPTAEFFVEVPPGLLGAVLRDLFVRTPLWIVLRGPGALTDFAKAVFSQLVIIMVAMFDRARGLVDRLITGAMLVWDTIQGGLHWIALLIFMQIAPWVVNVGIEAFDQMILLANAAVIFVVAARRWLWRTITGLPRMIADALTQLAHAIGRALNVMLTAVLSFIRAIPVYVEAILRGIGQLLHWLFIEVPLNVLRALWSLTTRFLHYLSIELPLEIARTLSRLATQIFRALFIELPRLVVNWVSALAKDLWTLGTTVVRWVVELPGNLWRVAVFMFVTLPREFYRGLVYLIRDLRDLVVAVARALSEPTMTVLTWTLAILIAPFYYVARLLGIGHSGRHPGPGGQHR